MRSGEDALGVSGRVRYHTDDSIQYKYLDRPEAKYVSKAAFSLTGDAGCEHGGGVSCHGDSANMGPKQSFLGFIPLQPSVVRSEPVWTDAWRGAGSTIPAAILCCCRRSMARMQPPVRRTSQRIRETSSRRGMRRRRSDYMPSQYITWRLEYDHRAADVPYFSGPGGITPPAGNKGDAGVAGPGMDTGSAQQREPHDRRGAGEILKLCSLSSSPLQTLCQRQQQREICLQKSSILRRHLVPQVQRQVAQRNGSLVHVRARRAECRRQRGESCAD